MNDTALVLLAIVATSALILSILNHIEIRDHHKYIVNLYGHVSELEQKEAPLDPDVWTTEPE